MDPKSPTKTVFFSSPNPKETKQNKTEQ